MVAHYRRWGKRTLDVVVSAIVLVALLPVLAIVAALVFLRIGAPVLFRQVRPGLNGRPFTLVKFRTMSNVRSSGGQLLPDAARMTPLGRALRSTSLDELPEFWNVLRGDMSLVGPRPLLTQYLDRYSAEQSRRHDVRPGITGLAQVSGRNATTWDDRLRLDVEYVDRYGATLDLDIIARTVAAVVTRKGIAADGHATMPEFMGAADATTAANVAEPTPARDEARR